MVEQVWSDWKTFNSKVTWVWSGWKTLDSKVEQGSKIKKNKKNQKNKKIKQTKNTKNKKNKCVAQIKKTIEPFQERKYKIEKKLLNKKNKKNAYRNKGSKESLDSARTYDFIGSDPLDPVKTPASLSSNSSLYDCSLHFSSWANGAEISIPLTYFHSFFVLV